MYSPSSDLNKQEVQVNQAAAVIQPVSELPQVQTATVETTVAPPPEPIVAERPPEVVAKVGCEAYRELVAQYDWDVNVAVAVMRAESGCNPSAISPVNYDGLHDHGLFQLHGIDVYDPAENIRIAYTQKYLKGGWTHWTVCTRGIVSCY